MNLWDWLNEITYIKRDWSSFTEDQYSSFNPYMIHRFISQESSYIEIANLAQRLNPENKRSIYEFYKNILPKRKIWNKYIKADKSQVNKDLLDVLSKYFELSKRDVLDYIKILNKDEIKEILTDLGFEKKEQTKLLKKS